MRYNTLNFVQLGEKTAGAELIQKQWQRSSLAWLTFPHTIFGDWIKTVVCVIW